MLLRAAPASCRHSRCAGASAAGRAAAPRPLPHAPLQPRGGPHRVARRGVAASPGDEQQPEPAAPAPAAPAVDAVRATAEDASAVVGSAADAATALVRETASQATGIVDDAAAAATAAVNAASSAAAAVVSDATDVSAALVADATAAAEQLRAGLPQPPRPLSPGGPIDWSEGVGGAPNPRFAGLKVLVVGATGGVGRRVVAALRARGVPCRALVRDRDKAARLLPPPSDGSGGAPAFETAVGDVYQYATLPPALAGYNAVIVASGCNDRFDPLGPFNVDYQGNLNLIAAAEAAGVKRFVLVTSIGTDDILNPLNLFGGILFWKKRAEEALQRSRLTSTIIRPGGLMNSLRPGTAGPDPVLMGRPGTFGFPPKRSGAILRSQVADVCVEALVAPAAVGKVVEIIADRDAPELSVEQMFEGVRMAL